MSPDRTPGPSAAVDALYRFVEQARHEHRGVLTIALCGAQGSGKSTLAAAAADRWRADGLRVALLSLDDLYLTRRARAALAVDVHPLLATRGVPGTHDIALGERVLADLALPRDTALPRFDKARDEPWPVVVWPVVAGPVDVILLEGWCVGAVPQAEADLMLPVNALEREHDRDGRWRTFVNRTLASSYQRLFARLDRLVLLAAPGFDMVARWRRDQEHVLRARLANAGGGLGQTMDDAAVDRFVGHYERLTRHILAEMPARADLVLKLDADRTLVAVGQRVRA